MRKAVKLAALAAGVALLTFGAAANAQQLAHPRTDYAAYTRPKGTLAVGPFKVEHGIIDEIMVGTYVPPWFAFPWLKVPVPSVYGKFRTSWWDPVTLSLRADLVYVSGTAVAELKDENASASGVSTSGDIAASWRINEKYSATLALDYARLRAVGESTSETTSIEGASTADTYSVRAFGEWRLNKTFAVTLLFRYLIYQSPISADTTSESDSVSVDAELTAEGTVQKRFSITPGVSFVWERWELAGGVGYGVFYLPLLGLASAKNYPLFDLSVAYRFDLYD